MSQPSTSTSGSQQPFTGTTLVTTAGTVGRHVTRLLARAGQPVRVLVRSRERAADLAQAGAQVVEGDLDDLGSLRRAVAGTTAVVLVSPGRPRQETGVIDAARAAGAAHVVKVTSDASAGSPISRRRDHHEIEQALLASGLPHTLLRANAFQQNLLALAPAVSKDDAFASPTGRGRVGMVDAQDVAAVAAAVAAAPTEHAGRTYWLSGPQALSYDDAAAVMSDVLGRTITHRSVTAAEQTSQMLAMGLPPAVAEANTKALQLFAEGDADWTTGDVARLTGKTPRTLRDFLRAHAGRFAPAGRTP